MAKGFVGEGWKSRGTPSERLELRPAPGVPPPAEMKLQASMRGRMGEGRGRGMTLTSRRQVLGLQRAALGWSETGAGDFSSESCVSWQRGRSRTGKDTKNFGVKLAIFNTI